MPAKIILRATLGPLSGKKYRFDEQMLCIMGRADSCTLQFSGEEAEGVSRHHCILDIRPPQAFIRDLRSKNGTFVNGRNIGCGDGENEETLTCELHDKDRITVAGNEFQIRLLPPLLCRVCKKELPEPLSPGLSGDAEDEDRSAEENAGEMICQECLAAGYIKRIPATTQTVKLAYCFSCGAGISVPVSARDGERFLCKSCQIANQQQQNTYRMRNQDFMHSNLLPIKGYKVIKQIGRGGMGAVYLAEKDLTFEKVAIKILLPDIAVHEQCREDFLREARNLRPLIHPNIVALRDCAYAGGSFYLVMEYCSGGTLRDYLKRRGKPFALPLALELTGQILDALDYAHNITLNQASAMDEQEYHLTGLVHRDIKPENIFLHIEDGNPVAKIADFGIAKAFDLAGLSGCTRTGDFSGTLAFIPKQQFLNYKYVKPEVDVWASAATLYYMLAGVPPRDFSIRDVMEVFNSAPAPIRSLNPSVPEALATVIDAALDDRLSLKYKSAASFKCALFNAKQ